jgi:hypothetical protein
MKTEIDNCEVRNVDMTFGESKSTWVRDRAKTFPETALCDRTQQAHLQLFLLHRTGACQLLRETMVHPE